MHFVLNACFEADNSVERNDILTKGESVQWAYKVKFEKHSIKTKQVGGLCLISGVDPGLSIK